MSTEYGKIETLYERDKETFNVIPGRFKSPVYSLLKTWRWTEKVDGTNVRIEFTPETQRIDGDPYPDSIKLAKVRVGGRTDRANMPAQLVQNILSIVTPDKMAAAFQTPVVLYGEGYGAGIQKVGSLYSAVQKFILFDVLVDGKWWLNQEQITDVATQLGLDVVPVIGDMPIEDAVEMVRGGFWSRLGDIAAEGLVGRPIETMYDKRLHRIITKLKTKDFTGGKDA